MWMRDFFGLQTSRSRGKLDASEIFAPRRNAQEIVTPSRGEHFHLPNRRRQSKIAWKRSWIYSAAIWSCGKWRSQPRTSKKLGWVLASRNKRGRWSPQRLLVDWRRLYLWSSCWTSSSPSCAKKTIMPRTLKYIDMTRTSSHKSGCDARKAYQWLLECSWGSNFVRFVGRIYEVHVLKSETSSRIYVVREGAWRRSNQLPDHILCGLRFGLACQKQPKTKRSKNGLLRSESSTMLENWPVSSSIRKTKKIKKP